MKFTEQQIRKVAKSAGVSELSLQRLMGSVMIEVLEPILEPPEPGEPRPEQKSTRYNLGLRITRDVAANQYVSEELIQALSSAISEYKNTCPAAYNWIIGGAFNPSKIPDNLDRGKIMHASRTASRLRAKLLREAGPILR